MSDYKQLFQEQSTTWKLATDNYRALSKVIFKEYIIDGFRVRLQFNPGRIISSSANVSKDAITERPCFLCAKNRPVEQTFLTFEDVENTVLANEFQILVNPFPVFPQHFTIAAKEHQPQAIEGQMDTILRLAKCMDDCVVFYNGPRCGASAPDHLHFQAGSKGLMPIESDYEDWKKEHLSILTTEKEVQVYQLEGLLRNGWLMEGKNEKELIKSFDLLLKSLETVNTSFGEEPMLNFLCWYKKDHWTCVLFPRKKHRPDCYFRDNETKLLISPAAVEMGGLMIAARQEDFERITEDEIRDIYNEVSISKVEADLISRKFTDHLNA